MRESAERNRSRLRCTNMRFLEQKEHRQPRAFGARSRILWRCSFLRPLHFPCATLCKHDSICLFNHAALGFQGTTSRSGLCYRFHALLALLLLHTCSHCFSFHSTASSCSSVLSSGQQSSELPYAVVASRELVRGTRVRQYPWGIVEGASGTVSYTHSLLPNNRR